MKKKKEIRGDLAVQPNNVHTVLVPDHDGGRPIEVNACILITHMVYL
jgi:hypothetical protein